MAKKKIYLKELASEKSSQVSRSQNSTNSQYLAWIQKHILGQSPKPH